MRDAGFDDLLDAIETGDPYYLACPAGHATLPPRRVCPDCGATGFTEVGLPETGTVHSHTTIRVAAPAFEAETPSVTAIAEFGPVRLTGLLRGVDPEAARIGQEVTVGVEETAAGERVLALRPLD